MSDLVTEHGAPNWAPLESRLPLADCSPWMWMGTVRHDDRVIEQYKHWFTRRYLNLDQDGAAWRFEVEDLSCGPWCEQNHEHRDDRRSTAVPMPFDQALQWGLS